MDHTVYHRQYYRKGETFSTYLGQYKTSKPPSTVNVVAMNISCREVWIVLGNSRKRSVNVT